MADEVRVIIFCGRNRLNSIEMEGRELEIDSIVNEPVFNWFEEISRDYSEWRGLKEEIYNALGNNKEKSALYFMVQKTWKRSFWIVPAKGDLGVILTKYPKNRSYSRK